MIGRQCASFSIRDQTAFSNTYVSVYHIKDDISIVTEANISFVAKKAFFTKKFKVNYAQQIEKAKSKLKIDVIQEEMIINGT